MEHQHTGIWRKYLEMEMQNKVVNHAQVYSGVSPQVSEPALNKLIIEVRTMGQLICKRGYEQNSRQRIPLPDGETIQLVRKLILRRCGRSARRPRSEGIHALVDDARTLEKAYVVGTAPVMQAPARPASRRVERRP